MESPRVCTDHMRVCAPCVGKHLATVVVRCQPDDTGVTAYTGDGTEISAGHLALTAGARSRRIKGTGAETLPLGTERGYHMLYRNHGEQVSRPVGWAEAGLYATFMAHGLRIAGTVEINNIEAAPNAKSIAYLKRKSHEMFGPLSTPDDTRLGHRPTMPDALSVIGPSCASSRVILAFGHQHIGLTLGGVTGKIVTDLARGQAPSCDISNLPPSGLVDRVRLSGFQASSVTMFALRHHRSSASSRGIRTMTA
ncbi:NAD(P)/FAD-dependent oxidoreductase [uncultured Sulfitobacter sp.]|uniref:NAD(P)/FAD-dependent oxidoreductase n=1 Tax=Sulfitobacter sp. SH22 TaxID=3421172 RepID=UPI0025EB2564|nr:FAD-binding oxidoreductase [uncultured Sulfitobacter sp.]